MGVAFQPLGELRTMMFDVPESSPATPAFNLLGGIKGAVLAIIDNEDGGITVLVKKDTTYEWLDITECIPKRSKRKYDQRPVIAFPFPE